MTPNYKYCRGREAPFLNVLFIGIAQIALDHTSLCQTGKRGKKSDPNHLGKPLHPWANMGKKVPQTMLASLYPPPSRKITNLKKGASLMMYDMQVWQFYSREVHYSYQSHHACWYQGIFSGVTGVHQLSDVTGYSLSQEVFLYICTITNYIFLFFSNIPIFIFLLQCHTSHMKYENIHSAGKINKVIDSRHPLNEEEHLINNRKI